MLPFKSRTENRRRITFYYLSSSEGPALRYFVQHKSKELKICINMSWDPLEWLIFRATVLHWKTQVNRGCQTKDHCSWLHHWTCQSNHRIPPPSITAGKHHSLAADLEMEISPWESPRAPSCSTPSSCSGSASFWRAMLCNIRVIWVEAQFGGMQLSAWCMFICNPSANFWSWNKAKCKKERKLLGFYPCCKVSMDH